MIAALLKVADADILLLSLGLLLLFVECLRPGRVLPGAAGLLLLLLGIHGLASLPLRPAALLLIAIAVILLTASAIRRVRWPTGLLGTAALAAALPWLVTPQPQHPRAGVTPWLGVLAGLVLGAASSLLLQAASRARANKRTPAPSRAARVD